MLPFLRPRPLQKPRPTYRHADTSLTLAQTAYDHRLHREYRKTYDYPGEYIDGYHRWLGARAPLKTDWPILDIGIEGWLFRADALKLYELAYFNPSILELGTYKGLSTTILTTAIFNSGHAGGVHTVDLDPASVEAARAGMEERHVHGREMVWFASGDATAFTQRQIDNGRRFSFVFIDHSHEYEPMVEICGLLGQVTEPGGFCLFHDFNDPRNANPRIHEYGVFQAVEQHLPEAEFEFWGVFGCTGLYRRR